MNAPIQYTHEILYTVAEKYLKLTTLQKVSVGMRLGLTNLNSYCYPSSNLDQLIFVSAIKQYKLAPLVREIERVVNGK